MCLRALLLVPSPLLFAWHCFCLGCPLTECGTCPHLPIPENPNVSVVNGLSGQQASRVQVSQVEHTQGPWDGSLYATVNKQRRAELEAASLAHNGPSHLPNGSLTSSVDSGAARLPVPPVLIIPSLAVIVCSLSLSGVGVVFFSDFCILKMFLETFGGCFNKTGH